MPTRTNSPAINEENRRLRRAEQFRKRLAVLETIGRPNGITNKELCAEYGFKRISIKKQARYLSLDVKWTVDENGHERYTPARPLPTLVSVVAHRTPDGNELVFHGLTQAEAAGIEAMHSERLA